MQLNVRDQMNAAHRGVDLREVFAALWSRRRLIGATIAAGTLAGVLAYVLLPARYTATTDVMIQSPGIRVFDDSKTAVETRPPDDAAIDTQVKVLASRSNVMKVIDALHLEQDAELARGLSAPSDDASGWWKRIAAQLWPWAGAPADQSPIVGNDDVRAETIFGRFQDRLRVRREGDSHVISVSYTSENPQKAADVANAVVRIFIESQISLKGAALDRTEAWFAEQIDALRARVLAAEDDVEAYRAANGLLDRQQREKGSLDTQRLDSLNAELTAARSERIAKELKLRQVSQLRASGQGYKSLAEVAASPVIISLLQREGELSTQEAQLNKTYGEMHPLLVQVRAERAGLEQKLRQEISEIVRGLESEARLAQARERALEESLARAKDDSAMVGRAEIQLRELEREAASRRAIYEAALVRSKEIAQRGELLEPDARVIGAAVAPAAPSFPKLGVFVALAFLGSAGLGVGLAALREHLDRNFRSSRQMEESLGLSSLGLVPKVPDLQANRPHRYLLSKPLSRYAEAVSAISSSLDTVSPHRPPVIMVTSALPGEGKTTLAMSLGASLARAGRSTVVVDMDLRHPGIARELDQPVRAGLVEVLEGRCSLAEAIVIDPDQPGLHVIPIKQMASNPVELLSSPSVRALIEELRQQFAYVLLDAPPVLVVSDAKRVAAAADAVLFVVQWEKTSETAAANGLHVLQRCEAPVIGAALTQVDLRRHARYGLQDAGQYSARYDGYFIN